MKDRYLKIVTLIVVAIFMASCALTKKDLLDDSTVQIYGYETIVPVPAAAYLFASGLGLLGWFRRRQTA
jgi:hypothetical protein